MSVSICMCVCQSVYEKYMEIKMCVCVGETPKHVSEMAVYMCVKTGPVDEEIWLTHEYLLCFESVTGQDL